MPRSPISRWIRRRAGPRSTSPEAAAAPGDRERRDHLSLRWIAGETGDLVRALPFPDGAAREDAARRLLRCSESAAAAARELERTRRALEVHGGGSIP